MHAGLVFDFLLEAFDLRRSFVVVRFNQGSAKSYVPGRNMKVTWFKRSRGLHDATNVSADDALVGTAHTNIALKGRATRKDGGIRGWHMRMRAKDGGDLAVKKSR